MIFVDAHVHIHECFSLPIFLREAEINFRSQLRFDINQELSCFILMLAEQGSVNYFRWFVEKADKFDSKNSVELNDWSFQATEEPDSVIALNHRQGGHLYIIAGQQIITSEDIEVIALATRTRFQNNLPLEESIEQISFAKGIPLVPWGVGKWFGKRGKVISKLIRSSDSPSFCIGDNSGRPVFWREPHLFKSARKASIPILPGSDPLPFVSEQNRAGAFGFSVDAAIDLEKPAETIKTLAFKQKNTVQAYGNLERIHRFFLNQIKMQIRKRLAN